MTSAPASTALVPVSKARTGVLLLNLGTPDSPAPGDVRRYLRQFLSDPRVLDIGGLGRWMLLNLIILPTRPKKSGEAYAKIWDATRGSPLLYHSQDLAAGVRAALGDVPVALGMRYGRPSLGSALDELERAHCTRVIVLPLYPQYASSSTGSSLEELFRILGKRWNVPAVDVVPPFYDAPPFERALAAVGAPVHAEFRPDHVLMSFHGLPERQIKKSDPSGAHCLAKASCCDRISDANANCYRAQSYHTARVLAGNLGLGEADYTVCFQSRLGRTPWIEPHTDKVLVDLAKAGKKRLLVFCPAFVADCLETLEEIAMRARADFVAAGGEDLRLVPSLNASAPWVDAVAELLRARL